MRPVVGPSDHAGPAGWFQAVQADIRFYVDADVLGLAKLLVQVRNDVTYPGGRDAIGTWAQLEVFMIQWRAIERCSDEPGPFVYSATRSTFRPVDLDP